MSAPHPDSAADAGPDRAIIRLGSGTADPRQVVSVPGTAVPLVALDLPQGLRGAAREQVARRQLADRSGQKEGALDLRPCLLPAAKGAAAEHWTRVLTADPAWLAGLRQIQARAVLPDYLTLPAAQEVWTLSADRLTETGQEIIMARLGLEDGFSALPALLPLMLEQALRDAPPPAALLLATPLPAETEATLANMAATHAIPVARDIEGLTALGLPRPKTLAHGELACDLRHNPMAARARLARRVLPWRWPALALLLAAGLWSATEITATRRIAAETAALSAQTQTLVRQHFIPDGPLLDLRLQVSRALADLRKSSGTDETQSDPLELTARAAAVIAAAGARPDTLSYRAGEELRLGLQLADFAAADRIAADLRAAGLAVEVADLRVSDDAPGVRGEFIVTHRSGQEERP